MSRIFATHRAAARRAGSVEQPLDVVEKVGCYFDLRFPIVYWYEERLWRLRVERSETRKLWESVRRYVFRLHVRSGIVDPKFSQQCSFGAEPVDDVLEHIVRHAW